MGDVAPSRLVPPFEVALEKGVRAFLRLSPTSWLKASKGHLPNEWGGRRYKAGPACERPFGDHSGRLPCMRSGRSPLSRQARATPLGSRIKVKGLGGHRTETHRPQVHILLPAGNLPGLHPTKNRSRDGLRSSSLTAPALDAIYGAAGLEPRP